MYPFYNGKFKEAHIWWDTEIDPSADVDVFFFIHDFKGRAKYKYGFKTSQIKLDQEKRSIWDGYKSNLRNEIRTAEKIGYEMGYISSPSKEEIESFVNSFNGFADYKKIGKTSSSYLEMLANDKKLVISYIKYNGEILYGHSHYVAKGIARLLHSFSNLTDMSGKIVSLGNKMLTHSDIMYFKESGCGTYDFGGIGNVDGDNSVFSGIIKFKKSFGGEEIILWKGVTPNGEEGKAIMMKYFKNIKL